MKVLRGRAAQYNLNLFSIPKHCFAPLHFRPEKSKGTRWFQNERIVLNRAKLENIGQKLNIQEKIDPHDPFPKKKEKGFSVHLTPIGTTHGNNLDPEAVVKHLIADAICRYRIKKGENISYTPFFCPDTYQSRFKVAKHLLDQNESDLLKDSKDGTPNHNFIWQKLCRIHGRSQIRKLNQFHSVAQDKIKLYHDRDVIEKTYKLWDDLDKRGAISQVTEPAICSSFFGYSLPEGYLEYKEKDCLRVWAKVPLSQEVCQSLGVKSNTPFLIKTDQPWKLALFEGIAINSRSSIVEVEINSKKFLVSTADLPALEADKIAAVPSGHAEIVPNLLTSYSLENSSILSLPAENLPKHYGKIILSDNVSSSTLIVPGFCKESFKCVKATTSVSLSNRGEILYGRYAGQYINDDLLQEQVLADSSSSIVRLFRKKMLIPFEKKPNWTLEKKHAEDRFEHLEKTIVRPTTQFILKPEEHQVEMNKLLDKMKINDESVREAVDLFSNAEQWALSSSIRSGVPLPLGFCSKSEMPVRDTEVSKNMREFLSRDFQTRNSIDMYWNSKSNLITKKDNINKSIHSFCPTFLAAASHITTIDSPSLDFATDTVKNAQTWLPKAVLLNAIIGEKEPPVKHFRFSPNVVDSSGVAFTERFGKNDSFVGTFGFEPEALQYDFGVDIFRFWTFKNSSKSCALMTTNFDDEKLQYNKIRKTTKVMLDNILDFDPTEMKPGRLSLTDTMLLSKLHEHCEIIEKSFEDCSLSDAVGNILKFYKFCDESILRPLSIRLYARDGYDRSSAQSVVFAALTIARQVTSPIFPILSEEIWQSQIWIDKQSDPDCRNAEFDAYNTVDSVYFDDIESVLTCRWQSAPKWWKGDEELDSLYDLVQQIKQKLRKKFCEPSETGHYKKGGISYGISGDYEIEIFPMSKFGARFVKLLVESDALRELTSSARIRILEEDPTDGIVINLPEKLSVSEKCRIKVRFAKTENQECPRCGGFFIEPKPKDPFMSLDSSSSDICSSCSDYENSYDDEDEFEFYLLEIYFFFQI